MRRIPWNLCTTFAAIGTALAYSFLLTLFGYYWVYLPGGLAGALAAYATSTALGLWAFRVQLGRSLIRSAVTGVGVALVTLFLGALALGVANFTVETTQDLISAPTGQTFWNALVEFAPHNTERLIGPPVAAALLFGFLPASVLGLIYGTMLHVRFDPGGVVPVTERRWTVGATGGTLLTVVLIAGLVTTAFIGSTSNTSRRTEMPIAISECGGVLANHSGVLAYCRGHPCDQGECEWGVIQDAFALYVEPPVGGGWKWTGGGLGTARHPHLVQHNMYWVQPGSGGFFDENNPRKFVHYQLRFKGKTVEIGGEHFQFEPGMLFVIQFADDWSFTVGVGRDGLQRTQVTFDDLQQAFDDACTMPDSCKSAFQIQTGNETTGTR